MIIAMPNNQVVHRGDPKHAEPTFPLFDKELRQHIIPVVEKAYSTQSGPRGRAIAGLSMGGRHAQLGGSALSFTRFSRSTESSTTTTSAATADTTGAPGAHLAYMLPKLWRAKSWKTSSR